MYPTFFVYFNISLFHFTFVSLPQDETQSLIPEIDAAPTPPEDQLALDTQPNAKTAFLLSIDELLSAVRPLS